MDDAGAAKHLRTFHLDKIYVKWMQHCAELWEGLTTWHVPEPTLWEATP